MSTSAFPASLDSFTNPSAGNFTNAPSLAAGQTLQNDALAAVEAKVGVDGSAVTSSISYKLSGVTGSDKAVSKAGAETLSGKTLSAPVFQYLSDSGSANAVVLTPSPAASAYSAGMTLTFAVANPTTGACTVNVSGLGAKSFKRGTVDPEPFAMVPNVSYMAVYDGTNFQLVNNAIVQGDGWTPVTLTATYASASTFTLSGDWRSVLSNGTPLKATNSGQKYFYVVGASFSAGTTTVTVTGGTDYSLANAAISSLCFSKGSSPADHPCRFSTSVGYITMSGRMCEQGGIAASASGGPLSVTFATAFATTPTVVPGISTTSTAVASGVSPDVYSVSASGFNYQVWNTGGSRVLVNMAWMAKGTV